MSVVCGQLMELVEIRNMEPGCLCRVVDHAKQGELLYRLKKGGRK